MKKFSVFASGNGSNLGAIIDAVRAGGISAELVLVVSDKKDAYALKRAENAGIEFFCFDPKDYNQKEDYERIIVEKLGKKGVDFIVLAGFMKVLTPYFINIYRNKILNIHPALLPSFPGGRGVRDALQGGVKFSGVTVHFVDEKVDSGPIILQDIESVLEDDTEDSLLERLHKIEYRLYPKAIQLLVEDRLLVEGRCVKIIN
ncbi:MAG: phosphoribosylglycinamide formyltransferase [Candidatus Saelkia tenebricola]|nr:phosphoribosylglycinamide formyltransferase [Candidatus Saelkia tenebricola]